MLWLLNNSLNLPEITETTSIKKGQPPLSFETYNLQYSGTLEINPTCPVTPYIINIGCVLVVCVCVHSKESSSLVD